MEPEEYEVVGEVGLALARQAKKGLGKCKEKIVSKIPTFKMQVYTSCVWFMPG